MPKYTEAFFNITHKPVTIMQIRNEYNLDHTVYERRYKGHIFCPYCKAVPLTVVHTNGLLYYRGHPHEEHGEVCIGNKHCKNAFPNAVLNFCQSC